MKTPSPPKNRHHLALVVLLIIFGLGLFFWWTEKQRTLPPARNRAAAPATNSNANATLTPATNSPALSPAQYATFQKKPFAIAKQTDNYAWTTNDGRNPQVIRELAHNDFEYQRMLGENPTIYRRQLVYQKNPFSLAAQKAVHFGEPISQLNLPNLDGQELTVDITKTEIEAGGDRGILTGKLAGRGDSLVSIAFIGGREGFTVVSPEDKIYLYAEPREPGELVVKKFDPATYGGVLAGCGVK